MQYIYSLADLITTDVSPPLLLVVDDQPSNIPALYAIFKDRYEVCMAVNNVDALAFCARRTPDLILLDVVMTGMGGYALCELLKGDPRTCDIPIQALQRLLRPLAGRHLPARCSGSDQVDAASPARPGGAFWRRGIRVPATRYRV